MKIYNKLVRDKIPQIIKQSDKKAVYRILTEDEYINELDKKLLEEVEEYQEDKSLEEIVDVMEVLYAICEARGFTKEDLEAKRTEKAFTRGGFKDKIYLDYVEE